MGSDLWVLMTVCQIPFEDFEETNLILAGSVVQSNTSLRSPEVELPIFPLAWFWYTSIHAQCFCYKNQLQIYRYTPNPNPSKHHIRMQHDLFAAWSISHARIWTYTDSGSTQAWRKSHKLCISALQKERRKKNGLLAETLWECMLECFSWEIGVFVTIFFVVVFTIEKSGLLRLCENLDSFSPGRLWGRTAL